MSPQVIELLFFAFIAFVIVNKLISILGTSDDIERKYKKSKFGEPSNIKDVTKTGSDWTLPPMLFKTSKVSNEIDTKHLLEPDNDSLINSLKQVADKLDKFSVKLFIRNASKAQKMIFEAIKTKDNEMLEELVDKRFVKLLDEKIQIKNKEEQPELKISDVTFFGNNIMIKIYVPYSNGPEEWTFSRNINVSKPNWYLSNIEKFIS